MRLRSAYHICPTNYICRFSAPCRKVQWAIDLLRLKQKYWFIAMIGAVCTLLFGILILANPFESTAILWTFIAVTLIVEAVVDILTLVFGRR